MLSHNHYKLTSVLKSLNRLFVSLLVVTCSLSVFFAYQWYKSANRDVAFFVTANGTYVGDRTEKDSTIARQQFEIENFATDFLERAFSHSEYTLEDNINKAVNIMDRQSGLYLLSKFDESVEELYKKYNGISTVKLEQLEVNMKQYPYEVLISYTTSLHFPKAEKVLKDSELGGRLYFQVECLERSKLNPYGMMITSLRFVDKTPDKNEPST